MAIQFNLLPWREELRTKRANRNKYSLISAAILGLALGGAYFAWEKVRLNDHQEALSLVTNKNNSLKPKLKEKKALDELKTKLNNQIDSIEALQGDRASVSHMVEELSSANIQSLFLNKFTLNDGQVEITGVAENDSQISDLMKQLRKSPWYQEPKLVEIISNAQIGEETKSFKITSKLLLPGSEKDKEEKKNG